MRHVVPVSALEWRVGSAQNLHISERPLFREWDLMHSLMVDSRTV